MHHYYFVMEWIIGVEWELRRIFESDVMKLKNGKKEKRSLLGRRSGQLKIM